jgi:hypothetical protein
VNDIARLNVFSRPRPGRPASKMQDENDSYAKGKRCGNKWRLRLSYDFYRPLSCMSMTGRPIALPWAFATNKSGEMLSQKDEILMRTQGVNMIQ